MRKLVCTSEVYFDEGLFPWRPKGDQRVGDPPPNPHVDEGDQPPGLPPAVASSAEAGQLRAPPSSLAEAYDLATRSGTALARQSTRVLLLFSGPYARPDGLAAYLTGAGYQVELLDNDPDSGGGAEGDILSDAVYELSLIHI